MRFKSKNLLVVFILFFITSHCYSSELGDGDLSGGYDWLSPVNSSLLFGGGVLGQGQVMLGPNFLKQ